LGSRVGYRIRSGDETSAILRKQWMDQDIKEIVMDIAKTLVWGYKAGSGMCALREDLNVGRMSAALYRAVYAPPFDAIETDPITCDITDNGLFVVELVSWNFWRIWHHEIEFDDETLREPELAAEVRFTEGKSLADGMEYVEI